MDIALITPPGVSSRHIIAALRVAPYCITHLLTVRGGSAQAARSAAIQAGVTSKEVSMSEAQRKADAIVLVTDLGNRSLCVDGCVPVFRYACE